MYTEAKSCVCIVLLHTVSKSCSWLIITLRSKNVLTPLFSFMCLSEKKGVETKNRTLCMSVEQRMNEDNREHTITFSGMWMAFHFILLHGGIGTTHWGTILYTSTSAVHLYIHTLCRHEYHNICTQVNA